ncbi:tyrosine-type recombinase/integrase [Chromobacterium haemolyticum]|uniref:tyrosine-type recombinase/integrase n=1 Tax=Chromobacterium haemolyticum TaxID=394935 RepID=UPI00244CE80D|nr:tyrosine-type recombinase/integrase [Chromobacterium haemolyticum]MDH0342124.1 tyrosine-type recombinase/integrase [Chromobacterium haemolyticum]
MDTHFMSPYSPKTRRVYLSVIAGLLQFTEKEDIRHFSEFNKAWLRRFIGWNPDTGKMYSPPYQTLRLSALNIFWHWLVATGVLSGNPVIELIEERRRDRSGPRPQGGNTPQRLPIVLMWDDQRTLLNTVKRSKLRTSLRDHALIALILATGVRCEEICSLQLSHLDLAYNRLRVIGKGNKERIVVFEHDPEATGVIETWLEERASLLAWLEKDSSYLFISRTGRPLTGSLVYQQVSKFIKSAGLDDKVRRKGPHVLRHTATSIMFARSVPVLQIQENLGHSDLTTTQIYAHLLPQEKARAESPSF